MSEIAAQVKNLALYYGKGDIISVQIRIWQEAARNLNVKLNIRSVCCLKTARDETEIECGRAVVAT